MIQLESMNEDSSSPYQMPAGVNLLLMVSTTGVARFDGPYLCRYLGIEPSFAMVRR